MEELQQKNKSNEISNVESVVEEIERLPFEQQEVVFQRLEVYHGDLPHPNILKEYVMLYPDSAKKIIDNGIKESEHRREMEKDYLNKKHIEFKRGQTMGFVLALVMTLIGAYLIATDKTLAGSILSGVTALGIVGLFTRNDNERNKKEHND
ncbi:DUF2335 domain-containing protein [Tuanshanicoccus yangjingiae]|nr:DUF2335 domain-containing protein [Facklamia sp. 252]NEW68393.1 DUF2335 domain-containing protein [Facklamia sp. 253]QQD66488.1 DUF2335 domain-containing protein [Aerococcaceae bacterium zg-252]